MSKFKVCENCFIKIQFKILLFNQSKLSLLIDDQYLEQFADFTNVEELEVHVTWSGISGLDLLCIVLQNTLTQLVLEILEGFKYINDNYLNIYNPKL